MNDLIERYIYAATKRLDRKQREDVSLELRGLIDDMLEERCFGRTPEEKDIRIVLTELGTPQELYSRYSGDEGKCLIGQPYYTTYKSVLGIVIGCIVLGMTVAHLLLAVLEPKDLFTGLIDWFNGIWNGVFGAFGVVTLLFAFLQRKGIRVGESFNFDDLPPVPKRSKEIPKWECIAGIGFSVIFLILFVFTPELFCVVSEGRMVALFDPEAVRESWFVVVAFTACGIAREVVQLMERRYNRKVMTTALVSDAISAALAIWWLMGFELMNQTFLSNMQELFAGESAFIYRMFANFDLFFLGCILFALVLDSVDVTLRTLRK